MIPRARRAEARRRLPGSVRPLPPTRTVARIDPTVDPRWLALLARYPRSGLFHSPAWLSAVADAYGFAVRAHVMTDPSGVPIAGIAVAEVDDLSGPRTIALPFSDACDPLVSSVGEWEGLFDSLRSEGLPVHLRCLDDRIAGADARFEIVKRARWHTLSLASEPEAIWGGLAPATRRAIRKAERSGVAVKPLLGAEGLRDFHRLHVGLRKAKYRLLAQPFAFFEAIAGRFGEIGAWHPLGAFLGDRLIAATIYLRWGDTLYYKFNASDLGALDVRPNTLLTWAGISLARSLGCRALDLGPTDDDQPGLIRFKRAFGAAERELRFLRYAPPGWQNPRGLAARQLLGEITRLLTAPEVPDEVSGRAGALLYRFFA
jgi:CelD/BcsL family acetyltransferase involved in cellulose biosynthesis